MHNYPMPCARRIAAATPAPLDAAAPYSFFYLVRRAR
jgi:hypothetical protein